MQNFRFKLIAVVLLAFIFSACGENKKAEEQYLNDAKTQMDNQMYQEAIATYRELITAYPESDNALFAYKQIGIIYGEHLQDFPKTIEIFKEVSEKYPDTKDGKESMFMIAFTYDDKLKDKDNAVKYYKEFLAKYPEDSGPDDQLSSSAKAMLQFLESENPEQMIEEMIKKQEGNKTETQEKEPKKEDNTNQNQQNTNSDQDNKKPPTGKENETKTPEEKMDKNK